MTLPRHSSIVPPGPSSIRKQVLFGTTNQAKVDHLRELFEPLPIEILSARDLGIDIDVREDGRSPEEIEGLPDEKQPGMFIRRIHGSDQKVTDDEAIEYYVTELDRVGGESTGIWRIAIVLVISQTKPSPKVPPLRRG